MSYLSVVRTVARSGGLLLLPLLLCAQDQKPCWLRDGASPAKATALLLCEQGGIWKTTDSGVTWSQSDTGLSQRHRAFAWLDASRAVVVGNDGMILATEDGGKTWQPRTSGVKSHLMDVTFIGESGWISGYQGVVLYSGDGGKTWVRQNSGTTLTLETVFFLDKEHGWAAGWSATLIRTTDGGRTWAPAKLPNAQWTLTAISFTDANNGWVTGFGGQILRSKDSGATWSELKSPVQSWLTSIAFDQSGRGWITYDDGLLLSEDHGETWKQVPAGGRYFLGKLLPIDQSLWAIGQSVVLQQSGNGTEWKKNATLVTTRSLAPSDPSASRPSAK